ncbi:DNA topoisomerase III [Planococcus glaciei]|uniref:DNA topoisomerase n=1 Tax=Planococcus glaciei TaxID=459472 RepID=A0A7H8Q7F7_9BACL|nr:type IA DNA topoisomerase [Planococcus glaciei]ETP69251.1 DNA topoisomerase III [Planococcus glaciei CHR43]KOF12066.1 DNA topoisomerase III [Planococcus glaciei]MBX0314496.1 DNA topoisomerase 3 [Planococcus glaciei]QDY45060.1 DNA topoisomerase III [Planococcus glaciei]QKX49899.1 DNA topoisomerase 3 [Planococcus glaciei]
MKPVIVAEKPSQAKAYAEAFKTTKREGYMEVSPDPIFPEGAYITWGIGHLVELKEPKAYDPKWGKWKLDALPILPEQYQFQVARGKAQQFGVIKKLIQGTDTVINACDVDREGSNIFYSIYYQTGAKGKRIQRLWINSLEVDEVRKGFQELRDNRQDLLLYQEARARQISDWLVGMNGSRLYSLLLQEKGIREVFAIGRVQTPTVFLIYQREKEIEAFVPEPFYEIEGVFQAEKGKYKGKAKIKAKERKEVEELLAKHDITKKADGIVAQLKTTEKRVPPPMLHSLSTLQAAANRKWKYSPAKVLSVMQGLYEKKLVSYPRTDAQHITPGEFSYLAGQVEKYQKLIGTEFPIASKAPKKRFVDSAKVQEHYAIIPTKSIPTARKLDGLARDERNLYEEVLRTTLAMFHRDYRYAETKVTTDVKGLAFFTTGKTDLEQGWKELFPTAKETKQEPSLPELREQEPVKADVAIKEGMTTPPKPYTEGQLIAMMKTCGKFVEDVEDTEILKEIEGLGTEATRSGIIETIKRHEYITVNKNIVSITDKGRILCQSIEGNLLSSPSMTAKWETYLKKIGKGEGSPEVFLSTIGKFIHKLLEEVPAQMQKNGLPDQMPTLDAKDEIAVCPRCKKGKIVSRKGFYSCTEFDNGCKQSFPAVFLKKRLTAKQIEYLCTRGKTPVIKGFVSKNGKKFSAKLVLEEGKLKMEF